MVSLSNHAVSAVSPVHVGFFTRLQPDPKGRLWQKTLVLSGLA